MQYLGNLQTANAAATGQSQMLTSEGAGALTSGGDLANATANDYLNEGQQQIEDTVNSEQLQNQQWGGLANMGGIMAALGYGGGSPAKAPGGAPIGTPTAPPTTVMAPGAPSVYAGQDDPYGIFQPSYKPKFYSTAPPALPTG